MLLFLFLIFILWFDYKMRESISDGFPSFWKKLFKTSFQNYILSFGSKIIHFFEKTFMKYFGFINNEKLMKPENFQFFFKKASNFVIGLVCISIIILVLKILFNIFI